VGCPLQRTNSRKSFRIQANHADSFPAFSAGNWLCDL
jgi:hypothetical protein